MNWEQALAEMKRIDGNADDDVEGWHYSADRLVVSLLGSLATPTHIGDGNELAAAQEFVKLYEKVLDGGRYA